MFMCACRSGEYGRLGHDDEQMQTTPLLIELLVGKNVREISSGGFHTLALSSGGDAKPGQAGQVWQPCNTPSAFCMQRCRQHARARALSLCIYTCMYIYTHEVEYNIQVGQPYQAKKGGQRIGFATADGDDDDEDGAGRPETGATGMTEESGGADTESRAASRMSGRPSAKGAMPGGKAAKTVGGGAWVGVRGGVG